MPRRAGRKAKPLDGNARLRAPVAAWEFALALRYLRARRRQGGIAITALISFCAITAAVAVLIVVMSIMSGFRAELMDRTLSFGGHIYITGAPLQDAHREELLGRLRRTPGVVDVGPTIQGEVLLRNVSATVGARIHGIRPEGLASLTYVRESLGKPAAEAFERADGGAGILIGRSLADRLDLRPGDHVTVYAPGDADLETEHRGAREAVFRVAGVFSSGSADIDRAIVLMSLTDAQGLTGRTGEWDLIEVRLDRPDAVARVLGPIRGFVGPDGRVSDWRGRLSGFWGALEVQRLAMAIILSLIVAIAALNIVSSIVMLVKNKSRDIGILRTIGASRGSLVRVFFISGAMIGSAGTLAGLVLGLLVCLNIAPIQHFLEAFTGVKLFDADVYLLDSIPALVSPVDVMWVAAWSFFMSCVAGLIPSWKVASLDPIEALRP